MARPYAVDLREQVVRRVDAGLSRRAAAAKCALSVNCVVNLIHIPMRLERRGPADAPAASLAQDVPQERARVARELVAQEARVRASSIE